MKQLFRPLIASLLFTSCQSADNSQRADNRPTADDLRGKTFTVQMAEKDKEVDQLELSFRSDTTGQVLITLSSGFKRRPFSWQVLQDSILQMRIQPEGKDDYPLIWKLGVSWEGERILLTDKGKDAMLLTAKVPK